MAAVIPFPPYRPDVTDLGTDSSVTISGVVPNGSGYGPFPSFQAFTNALPANCRGFFFARNTDGSIAVFAGTATNLYQLNNSTFLWTNVSIGGGPYGSLVTGDNWQFAQYNTFVIAVQINTVPQKFVLGSATAFANLGGSPPQASHIAIVNFFVVLTGLLSNPGQIQWSDLDAPETWTAGVGLSDFQLFPDGGICHSIGGGDAFGVVFQDDCIRTLTYAPGSPAVFQIARISTQDTLFAQYSVVTAGTQTFYISAQGFRVIIAGGQPQPIGKEIIDAFFFGDVDRNNLQLVIGAVDPQATRVYWAYKSRSGSVGLFDKILCFDWSVQQRPWTLIQMSGQYLGFLAKPGITLEGMDALSPTPLTITGAANNGSGLIRLALSAESVGTPPYSGYTVLGQPTVEVYGVTGTTEANGNWQFTVIDPTHIDLTGSAFVNAYVSGGQIGGSLDALVPSLDSFSLAAVSELAMVGPTGALGFFSGANIEAILETPQQDMDTFVFLDGITPYTDAAAAVGSIGYRNTAQGPVNYTPEIGINSRGDCPVNVEAQFLKARLRIPAGSVWTYARGIKPHAQPAGDT